MAKSRANSLIIVTPKPENQVNPSRRRASIPASFRMNFFSGVTSDIESSPSSSPTGQWEAIEMPKRTIISEPVDPVNACKVVTWKLSKNASSSKREGTMPTPFVFQKKPVQTKPAVKSSILSKKMQHAQEMRSTDPRR